MLKNLISVHPMDSIVYFPTSDARKYIYLRK